MTVQGGQCSSPIEVPAGTATVSEDLSANPAFYLESVSTVSASDPMGTRLLTGATTNPATVTVPYGDVGNRDCRDVHEHGGPDGVQDLQAGEFG